MIKELMHDPIFLAGKSEVAAKEDLQVAQDLLDTLMAHRESCVGMAANMIGVRKRIIAFIDESGRAPAYTVMLNPEIIKKDGAYDTEDGKYDRAVYCSVCKELLSREEIVIEKQGHSLRSEWTVDMEPTCTESGIKSHWCSACGARTDITEI